MTRIASIATGKPTITFTTLMFWVAMHHGPVHGQGVASRRDSARVSIVENRFAGFNLTPGTEPDVRIGSVDGDSALSFSRVRFAARMQNGTIVVADGASTQLRWFSASGKFLFQFGSKGGGPGEFREFTKVFLSPGDTVTVYDRRNARLTSVSPTGKLVRTRAVSIDGIATLVGMTPKDSILQTTPEFDHASMRAGYNYARSRVKLLDESGRILVRELTPSERVLWVQTRDGAATSTMEMDLPFAAPVLIAVAKDRIIVADAARRRIEMRRSDGELLAIARRQGDPVVAVTTPHKQRFVDDAVERVRSCGPEAAAGARRNAEERLALLPKGHSMPAYDALIIDGKDRIWVRDYIPPGSVPTAQVWNVFDAQAVQVARVSVPRRVTVTHVSGDYLVGVDLDESDVEHVVVYRLR